jgi:hypothetical protein
MSRVEKVQEIDSQQLADEEAVLRHAFNGEPLDPEVLRRVDERVDRSTAVIRRRHGCIDERIFAAGGAGRAGWRRFAGSNRRKPMPLKTDLISNVSPVR